MSSCSAHICCYPPSPDTPVTKTMDTFNNLLLMGASITIFAVPIIVLCNGMTSVPLATGLVGGAIALELGGTALLAKNSPKKVGTLVGLFINGAILGTFCGLTYFQIFTINTFAISLLCYFGVNICACCTALCLACCALTIAAIILGQGALTKLRDGLQLQQQAMQG